MHRRLRRWCESNVLERIFRYLAAENDNEYMMIDSTIVRTHQHSARALRKETRIRPSDDHEATTKIHAICDAVGNPVELGITPGQDADITEVKPLLENIDLSAFLADKASDADSLIDRLIQRGDYPGHPAKTQQNDTTENRFFSLPRTESC